MDTIRRADIIGDDDAEVAVFPMKCSGLKFLKENNAWGFVRIGREFDYAAMYVSENVRQVKYFATVENVVPAHEFDLVRPIEEYTNGGRITRNKMVVRFQQDSLYELEDPIPFETEYPQSHRYIKLGTLREAKTTNDIF